MRALGALALAFYAIHAGERLAAGHPEDLLWSCHLACVWIGTGLLFRSATCNAIGFFWLCYGVPLWFLDLAGGGEFLLSSTLTHLGGLALGIHGLRRLGLPRGCWWKALAAFVLLQQLCRWLTPEPANVNLAFAVWAGWQIYFPSYFWYMLMLLGLGAITFLGLEQVARKWIIPASSSTRGT